MADHQIKIQVQTKKGQPRYGSMTYSWSALHAQPDDNVVWFSEDGPFVVRFRDRSPFAGNQHGISSEHTVDKSGKTLPGALGPFTTSTFRIAPGADVYGSYYYAVALSAAGEVFLDAGCPSVVIN
jgi:hypothetical protein